MSDHSAGAEPFETTHWSVVLAAGQRDSPRAEKALAWLCARYWPPLYAFVRRSGHSPHDAQDLTQAFFVRLLDKEFLRVADPQRGRFRSFLLASLKHFVANERKAARAKKRGGGRHVLSLDFATAEAAFLAEPADERTPERLFAQRWALLLLDRVLARLEEESNAAGQIARFQRLKCLLTAERDAPGYEQVAAELSTTEAAIKMAVHRLRKRYRELLREEIAQTVSDPADIDDELRELLSALS